MENMIEAAGLTKRYGEVTALDGLDLAVPEGTVLGLSGQYAAPERDRHEPRIEELSR